MPAPLTTALVLVLCGAPAMASRPRLDLWATRAALARRANASANASVDDANLDSALAHKGSDDESEPTPCVCFLEEVETEHEFWGEHKVKFTDLDTEKHFDSLEECAEKCPRECHGALKYKFDLQGEAHEVGAEGVSVSMTAAKCSDEGKCKCLDADTTVRRVREYKEREQRHLDIAQTKEVHDSPSQCLEHCECKDRKTTYGWSEQEFDFEGLCVDEWRWGWFLYEPAPHCYPDEAVGLVSCSHTQQFKLKEDRSDGGHAYKVLLDEVEDSDGHELGKDIKLKVVKFEAESSMLYRTSEVKVGIKGMKTKWTVYKTSVMGQRWSWTVVDEHGRVRFTINQQRWTSFKGSVWKAYKGAKSDGQHLYYAYGDDQAEGYEEGFEFKFYRDEDRSHYAGKLEHKKHDEEDNEDKYKVKVLPGEDAGLILLTSVLIDKDFDR